MQQLDNTQPTEQLSQEHAVFSDKNNTQLRT